ncbi:MAG TPA: ice-binding family protein [Solirubrobacteraceae bacterium]|nr:ice-binding family protein [Solirubrobacteraceae bacterium]
MSRPTHRKLRRRLGLALAAASALMAFPTAAQAVPVDLGTAGPFVVLGGQSVTNTGPSVLNGDLGVSPGTSLVGFGSPAVVNGATHNNDAVAGQAQADLIVAYDVAANEPVAPANVLTGTNLGNRTLTAGAYRYTSSAQLTGQLTLDAEGDPTAQFVFQIGSTLTTAPASSVRLINGASPCNVFWQVGSSAFLDTTTAFQGNIMALTTIALEDGASVIGRLLARNGSVTLINDVLDNSPCVTGSTTTPPPGGTTPPPSGTTPSGGSSSSGTSGTVAPAASGDGSAVAPPTATVQAAPVGQAMPRQTQNGSSTMRRRPRTTCTDGFRATVRGRMIRRVVFSLDGRRVSSRSRSPFQVHVRAAPGRHTVTARVTFTDATRARTLRLTYRACAAANLRPRRGPSRFTG